MVNAELCHHGIKGQKWGVRRTKNQLYRLQKAEKAASESYNKSTYFLNNNKKNNAISQLRTAITKEDKSNKIRKTLNKHGIVSKESTEMITARRINAIAFTKKYGDGKVTKITKQTKLINSAKRFILAQQIFLPDIM